MVSYWMVDERHIRGRVFLRNSHPVIPGMPTSTDERDVGLASSMSTYCESRVDDGCICECGYRSHSSIAANPDGVGSSFTSQAKARGLLRLPPWVHVCPSRTSEFLFCLTQRLILHLEGLASVVHGRAVLVDLKCFLPVSDLVIVEAS